MKKPIHPLRRFIAFPYIIFNSALFIILFGIMIYSALFSATKNHYPVSSSMEILKEGKDISSGLSRSFSELIRGRINSAREFNEYGPRIFLFFLLQLLIRPAFSFLYMRNHQTAGLIYLDAGISIVLFVLAFLPFIERFAEIVYSFPPG